MSSTPNRPDPALIQLTHRLTTYRNAVRDAQSALTRALSAQSHAERDRHLRVAVACLERTRDPA